MTCARGRGRYSWQDQNVLYGYCWHRYLLAPGRGRLPGNKVTATTRTIFRAFLEPAFGRRGPGGAGSSGARTSNALGRTLTKSERPAGIMSPSSSRGSSVSVVTSTVFALWCSNWRSTSWPCANIRRAITAHPRMCWGARTPTSREPSSREAPGRIEKPAGQDADVADHYRVACGSRASRHQGHAELVRPAAEMRQGSGPIAEPPRCSFSNRAWIAPTAASRPMPAMAANAEPSRGPSPPASAPPNPTEGGVELGRETERVSEQVRRTPRDDGHRDPAVCSA